MKRLIAAGAVVLAGAALGQNASQDRRSQQRGETPVQERELGGPKQSGKLQTWQGVLVDAGCRNRSSVGAGPAAAEAGRRTQAARRGSAEREGPGAASASGKSRDGQQGHVHSGAKHSQHADADAHQVPDVRSRQEDFSCAITGETSAFALLLPKGELLNLDQGGNTQAAAAFGGLPEGQAVLSGKQRGAKPRAEIKGRRRADQIVVESLRLKR